MGEARDYNQLTRRGVNTAEGPLASPRDRPENDDVCGLAGMLTWGGGAPEPGRLAAMRAALRHRGPDGEADAMSGPCGLAHTRLAVLDPAGGAQPMRSADGNLVVVHNGEIHNHRALRERLERDGHCFTSEHSDTEVLLHGYRAWGGELPQRLEGMFAFAVWDAAARTLLLARDPAGQKPLFIRHEPEALLFASLPSALEAAGGGTSGVNRGALRTYLQLGSTAYPALRAGVEELPAATARRVDADGVERAWTYWRPPPLSRHASDKGVLAAVSSALSGAVEKRLEADVPLGCFLSGGIDSTLIASFAQERLRALGGDALHTLSLGFAESDRDESETAAAVAAHLGTRHTRLRAPGPEAVLEDVEHFVAQTGEVTADSSLLATLWLSRAARPHVTAALCGDGGDELFAGYDRYRVMRWLRQGRWALAALPFGRWARRAPQSRRGRLGRLADAARGGAPPRCYDRIMRLCTPAQLHALGFEALPEPATIAEWPAGMGAVDAARHWDLAHYLPFDLLRKADRASMAAALELRPPMMDRAVYELGAHLPEAVLMPRGRPKAVLRQLARQRLPRKVARGPKRGFAVPVGRWFAGALHEALGQRLLDGTLPALGLAQAPVERWWREHGRGEADHTHRLFALLTLSAWGRTFL